MGVPAGIFWPGVGDWVTIMLAALGSEAADKAMGGAGCCAGC